MGPFKVTGHPIVTSHLLYSEPQSSAIILRAQEKCTADSGFLLAIWGPVSQVNTLRLEKKKKKTQSGQQCLRPYGKQTDDKIKKNKEFPCGLVVKDLAWSLLWLVFDPWLGNFHMP